MRMQFEIRQKDKVQNQHTLRQSLANHKSI